MSRADAERLPKTQVEPGHRRLVRHPAGQAQHVLQGFFRFRVREADLLQEVYIGGDGCCRVAQVVDEKAEETPAGCMAAPDDLDCGPIFDNLGLPFGGSEPGAQQFFSVE